MSGQIEIDEMSRRNVLAALSGIQAIPWNIALAKVLFRIKILAQLRLTEKMHIVTSRLKNSIYVKMPKQSDADKAGSEMGADNDRRYRWNAVGKQKAGTGDRDLSTVNLDVNEGAVGTNVEYGPKIERRDSFLYWAAKNINKNVGEYFKEIVAFNQKAYRK